MHDNRLKHLLLRSLACLALLPGLAAAEAEVPAQLPAFPHANRQAHGRSA